MTFMEVSNLGASIKLRPSVDFLGRRQTLTKPKFIEGRPDHTDALIKNPFSHIYFDNLRFPRPFRQKQIPGSFILETTDLFLRVVD